MRKNLGSKPYLLPETVSIIATYNSDNSVNIMNAAWSMMSDYDKVTLCLSKTHLTTENILRNKDFTISAGTKDTVASCDYVGIVSGKDDVNKFKKSKFSVTKSEFVNAPIINELPLALECHLISYDEKSEILVAKIINVSVDEKIINKETSKIDISKAHILVFDPTSNNYFELGNVVAKAFNEGNKLK